MRKTLLSDHWQFRSQDVTPGYHRPNVQEVPWLPAQVPGSVHLDLHRNGIIAEPFARQYEWGSRWVDEREWTYRTTFDWKADPALPQRVLRFNGLDTVCTIFLNGTEIARHDSFFVPLEVDVTALLESGSNELCVVFASAEKVGMARRAEYLTAHGMPLNTNWFDERAFVRKAGYMFAWDWGPRFVSCGFWQPVELLEFASRIRELTWHQEPSKDGFHVWPETIIDGDATLNTSFAGLKSADHHYEVNLAKWWPNGEGDPVLHLAHAEVPGQTWDKQIGLRTIKLIQEPDSIGRSFEFEVNGRRIYSRGANWIPNDSFPGRVTRQDYFDQALRAKQLEMNMLRVWGGGYYEQDAFFDACDVNGLLVWQDFPYACSYYPDDSAEQAVAEAEARANVRRLRDHASLAIWCGNNENLTMWEGKWGGPGVLPDRYYGENIYNTVLPKVVAEENPQTPYIASSPIGEPPERGGSNGNDFGDQHYWDVWHGRGDWFNYAASGARFCSEFGFASSCSLAQWKDVNGVPTLESVEAPFPSPEVLWHDKTGKGYETFRSYVDLHYPRAEKLEDWVYYSQLNQRDALRFGIEFFRRSEFCKGSLIWQMNDCWPVQSWAIQDYNRQLKPAGHELRRLYAPVTIAVEPHTHHADGPVDSPEIHAWVINDSPDAISTVLKAEVVHTVTGEVVQRLEATVSLKSGKRTRALSVDKSPYGLNQHAIHFVLTDVPASDRWHFLGEPKELSTSAPQLSAKITGGLLEVTVEGFAAELVIWDPQDAENIKSLQTHQPGLEAHTVANGILRYEVKHPPSHLVARTLSGVISLPVE
jgi:beta-mannosidase